MSIITTFLPNNNSVVHLLLYLISGKCSPKKLWNSKIFRTKFIVRSIIFPIVTFHYLNNLSKLPALPQLLLIQGLIPVKPHRPYLCANFNVAKRAQAIIAHYTLMNQLEGTKLCQILQSPNDNLLASFMGRNDNNFLLHCCSSRFDREGEITLELRYQALLIASLSFTIVKEDQQLTLLIGGLQGPHKHISRNVIRDATKAMHGIFPKRLLMEAVFILVELCGVQKIIAVSDTTHVFRSMRYRFSKSAHFFTSYSEFWLLLGGKVREDGMFLLPLRIVRKDLKNIASKKRAEYRRRYALLDNLIEQIYQAAEGKQNDPYSS